MDLQPGNVIDNRYIVEAEIGRGGMAAVYRVRHAQLGTLAALKVLTMPAASIQERLLHEGRVQAALQHPNIVTVSDVVIHNGAPGLVMEYVRGPSLDDFLIKRRMSMDQADEIAQGVLAGVRAAHNHGLIHRDLKPANIMLAITDSGLIPKVADFGLVKMLEGDGPSMSKTRSGVAMGTPAYMAPEQISDAKNVDYRADIFSLGAILYELVTNVRAFDHEDMFQTFSAIMSANFTPITELNPEVPERMQRAILGALTTERDERIQTVSDLLAMWNGEVSEDGSVTASSSVWGAEFLSEMSSMGGGGESSAESLRRSMRSGMGNQDVAGQTAAPHPNDQATRVPRDAGATQATMAPIPGMFEQDMPDSAQAPHPNQQEKPDLYVPGGPTADAPPPTPAPVLVTESQPSTTGPVAAIGVLGLFFLIMGIVAISAWQMGVFDGTPATVEPNPEPQPATPDPLPKPDPVEPTEPAQPVAPRPPTPDPPPEPVNPQPTQPEPVNPLPTQPEPVIPEPVEPQPAVPTEPQPSVPTPVVPPPEPPPAPEPPLVHVHAPGMTVTFHNVHGSHVPVERLQAGAKYEIRALWGLGDTSVVEAARVFENDMRYQVKCSAAKRRCLVK